LQKEQHQLVCFVLEMELDYCELGVEYIIYHLDEDLGLNVYYLDEELAVECIIY
jgi:hypothetical protein